MTVEARGWTADSDTLKGVAAVHKSLTQRLVIRHRYTGRDRDEVDAYLAHRLRLAGCELPLSQAPAVEALFQCARGLPCQTNRIAHYA